MKTYSAKTGEVERKWWLVDAAGHSGDWNNYITAITNADNIVYQLWQTIQSGTYGYTPENTTMFVTNDHGRHTGDDWKDHGDNCDGCEHIMLLAIGRNVTAGVENSDLHHQIDIAPTIGDLLGFSTPEAVGVSLYQGSNPLPVELTFFSARLLKNGVILNWGTETEVNNYGFEIEREVGSRQLAVGKWEMIGFVEGHGNSNSPKEYSFIDNNVTVGKYAYRLKQIDNDGTFEYSKIIEIDVDAPLEFELSQNYPNPFNPSTTIKFSLPVTSNVKLSIFNILGEEIQNLLNETKEAGVYTINFNASQLNSGIYFYKLETKNFIRVKKMSLIR